MNYCMENHINIPSRFYKEIVVHVVSNLIADVQQENGAYKNISLLLGVHGKSGQGKTFQIEKSLEKTGFEVFRISGSQLESERAGEPAQLIKQKYIEAGSYWKTTNKYAVLLIDDVDAGFGLWGGLYQYTVNTQIVIATLMHLADHPENVDGKEVPRIPIILTGNDFTKIYEPISRPGRMRSFVWEPSTDEKCEMLAPVFPLLDRYELETLIGAFPDEPISFFTELDSFILQEKIWNWIKGNEPAAVEAIKTGKSPAIETLCLLNELLEAGKVIASNSTFKNHLK